MNDTSSQIIHDGLSDHLMRLRYEIHKSIAESEDNRMQAEIKDLRERVANLERQIAELKAGVS